MITLRFWGELDTFGDLAQALYGALDGILKDSEIVENDMRFTLNDNSLVIMHIPDQVQNPTDFAVIQQEFMSYISRVYTDKFDVQIGLVRQFATFNTMMEIMFADDGNDTRLDNILLRVIKAVGVLNGVIVMPNLNILDGEGNMVFSYKGRSDFDDYPPLAPASVGVGVDSNAPSIQDENRYRISANILQEKSVPVSKNSSDFALREVDCSCRDIYDIARRLVSLFSVAFYSEFMLSDSANREVALAELFTLYNAFDFTEHASNDELEYLNSDEFDPILAKYYSSMYECVAVLLWSLGLYDDLGDPIDSCDVDAIFTIVCSYSTLDELVEGARPLSIEELLQEHDIIMKFHLACREKIVNQQEFNYPLDSDIVELRYTTLTWLANQSLS